MKVDVLIKNGLVIDPFRQLQKVNDIAVKDGLIVSAEQAEAVEVIDAAGCIVSPGLIDFHAHFADAVTALGISPAGSYYPTGVTAAVDAGSTGVDNYLGFRERTLAAPFRTKALLNICSAGLTTTSYHENIDPKNFKRSKIISYFKKYADQLLGLKIRQSTEIAEGLGLEPMREMLKIAKEIGCPIFVHTTNPPASPEEIAALLRPGDVYIHVFQGKGLTVIRNGQVIPALLESQRRGVLFDAANGVNHFSFEVAYRCLEQGFIPDIISTDLTVKSLYRPGKVFSLPYIMSKYLALGMPLPDIIERSCTIPAKLMGLGQELGSLAEGTPADITISRLIDKKTSFCDFTGTTPEGKQLIKTELTMADGNIMFRQIDFQA